jgi:hypothetical protein
MPDPSVYNSYKNLIDNDEFPDIILTQNINLIGNGYCNKGTNVNAISFFEALRDRLGLQNANFNQLTTSYSSSRITTNALSKLATLNNSWNVNDNASIIYFENDHCINNTFYNDYTYDVATEYLATIARYSIPRNKITFARNITTKTGTWTNSTPTPNNTWSVSTQTQNDFLEQNFNNCRYIFIQFSIIAGSAVSWQIIINDTDTTNYLTKANTTVAAPTENGNTAYVVGCILDLRTVSNHKIRIVNLVASGTVCHVDLICAWNPTDIDSVRPVLVISPPVFDTRYIGAVAGFTTYTRQKQRVRTQNLRDVCRTLTQCGLKVSFYQIKNQVMTFSPFTGNGVPNETQIYPSEYWFRTVANEVVENAIYTDDY